MKYSQWQEILLKFRFYLEIDRSLASITIRNYLIDLEHLYSFMEKNNLREFRDFNRNLIRRYLSWLIELGYVRRSVTRKLSTLRIFFSWLIKIGLLKNDHHLSLLVSV